MKKLIILLLIIGMGFSVGSADASTLVENHGTTVYQLDNDNMPLWTNSFELRTGYNDDLVLFWHYASGGPIVDTIINGNIDGSDGVDITVT